MGRMSEIAIMIRNEPEHIRYLFWKVGLLEKELARLKEPNRYP